MRKGLLPQILENLLSARKRWALEPPTHPPLSSDLMRLLVIPVFVGHPGAARHHLAAAVCELEQDTSSRQLLFIPPLAASVQHMGCATVHGTPLQKGSLTTAQAWVSRFPLSPGTLPE